MRRLFLFILFTVCVNATTLQTNINCFGNLQSTNTSQRLECEKDLGPSSYGGESVVYGSARSYLDFAGNTLTGGTQTSFDWAYVQSALLDGDMAMTAALSGSVILGGPTRPGVVQLTMYRIDYLGGYTSARFSAPNGAVTVETSTCTPVNVSNPPGVVQPTFTGGTGVCRYDVTLNTILGDAPSLTVQSNSQLKLSEGGRSTSATLSNDEFLQFTARFFESDGVTPALVSDPAVPEPATLYTTFAAIGVALLARRRFRLL